MKFILLPYKLLFYFHSWHFFYPSQITEFGSIFDSSFSFLCSIIVKTFLFFHEPTPFPLYSHRQCFRSVVSNLFSTSDHHGRHFSYRLGWGVGFSMIQVHYIYCAFYFWSNAAADLTGDMSLRPGAWGPPPWTAISLSYPRTAAITSLSISAPRASCLSLQLNCHCHRQIMTSYYPIPLHKTLHPHTYSHTCTQYPLNFLSLETI